MMPGHCLFRIRPYEVITDVAASARVLPQHLPFDQGGYLPKSGCPADLCHGHRLPGRQTSFKTVGAGIQQPVYNLLPVLIQQGIVRDARLTVDEFKKLL